MSIPVQEDVVCRRRGFPRAHEPLRQWRGRRARRRRRRPAAKETFLRWSVMLMQFDTDAICDVKFCSTLYVLCHFSLTLYFFSDNKILLALTRCEPEPLLALGPRQSSSSPPSSSSSSSSPSVTSTESDNAKYKIISTLSDFYDRELVGTIGWAKQIPGKPVWFGVAIGIDRI